jgi:hypothetical protein
MAWAQLNLILDGCCIVVALQSFYTVAGHCSTDVIMLVAVSCLMFEAFDGSFSRRAAPALSLLYEWQFYKLAGYKTLAWLGAF